MLSFQTFDVFTDHAFAGNPLAIVHGADGLSTAQMQVLAREFNLSETIFVRTPADAAHSAEVRIFFPTAEIPFAGHPTVGCAIALAEAAHGPGDWQAEITLEEQAGLVPVEVTRQGGVSRAQFVAPVVPHAPAHAVPQADTIARLAADALGVSLGEIGFGGHVPGVWSGGPTFLYVPVTSLAVLARARPMQPGWDALMAACGVDSAYLYTPADGADYQARMFSPTAGIPEDPATGSASAILTAQLLASGALAPGTSDLRLMQGVEMGRPSAIDLSVDVTENGVAQVRVAGGAVAISHGQVRVPDV